MLQCFLIALAISVDSFSVGMAYGIKNIKIPLRSIFILDIISISLLSIGFFAGNILTKYAPSFLTNIFGACILFIIGLWYIVQGWLNHKYPKEETKEAVSIAIISINSLGIAINIMRDPSRVDLDISGVIDTKEAILLGFALAADSLAVGLVVALSSLSMILITLLMVGILNLLLLKAGINFGKKYLTYQFREKTAFVPGIILIILAIIRLF